MMIPRGTQSPQSFWSLGLRPRHQRLDVSAVMPRCLSHARALAPTSDHRDAWQVLTTASARCCHEVEGAEDTLGGVITQISPSIDPEARTFKCFVEVDNPDGILLPGTFVKADLVVNSSENTLVIPRNIIISRNRDQVVYVVDKGVANERVITTGLQNEELVEVKMGLLKGESVVSSGFETLRDKSRVRILR